MQAIAPKSEAGAHVPNRTYGVVAGVLAVITLIEFSIVYVPALRPVVIPVLLVLSVAKFVLVAMYFMHLKFDSKLFWPFFASGVVLAVMVAVSLATLLNVNHAGMKM